jgi:pimeloyl-ACP methyl ester carboxylesterase
MTIVLPQTAPAVPTSVSADDVRSSEVRVGWHQGAGGGSLSGFEVRDVFASGAVGPVVASRGKTASSVVVSGLEDCDGYGFEVRAVGPGGQSGWSARSAFVVPHWTPAGEPRVAVILLEGINSVASGDVYYPEASTSSTHPSMSSYCDASDRFVPTAFPGTLQSLMEAFNPTGKVGPTVSMTDALTTHAGLVILPWSFTGVWLDPHAAGGVLVHVQPSDRSEANNTPVVTDAATLEAEVHSVHSAWPRTRIVILGHSFGGLIAEQYWEYYWRANHEGVTRMIALDAAINGVADADGFFGDLWAAMGWHDPAISSNDGDGAFLPIGTEGDAAYRSPDLGMDALLSQLLFKCSGSIHQTCVPIAPGFVSPCPSSDHAEEKACPGVIRYVEDATFSLPGSSSHRRRTSTRDPTTIASPSRLSFAALLAHLRVPLVRTIVGAPWAQPTTPAVAPGHPLRLVGEGLGEDSGQLTMAGHGGEKVSATITSWSPATVVASVPSNATSGELRLTTSAGAIVPILGVAVLARSGGGQLSLPARVTASIGKPLQVTVQLRDAHRPAAHRRVTMFDGVLPQSTSTNAAGVANFVAETALTRRIVVFSGTTWRTVAVRWGQPPVTAIYLQVRPAHPIAGSQVRITAVLRGPHGRVPDTPVTFTLSGVKGWATTPATVPSDMSGDATVIFRAPPGPATVTATSYGTTGIATL